MMKKVEEMDQGNLGLVKQEEGITGCTRIRKAVEGRPYDIIGFKDRNKGESQD
jgi:hypothetical protein